MQNYSSGVFGRCGSLSENGPHGLFGPWLVELFGKDEEVWLYWSSVSLGVGFEVKWITLSSVRKRPIKGFLL